MRILQIRRMLVLALILGASSVCAAPIPPAVSKPKPASDMGRIQEEVHTHAVVKIERPEGVCYWQITGGDALLRMPVKDSGYGNLLLSAQIVGDKLQVSAAGESQPLETTLLGRYSLAFKGDGLDKAGISADSLRFGGGEPWRLRIMPKDEFFALRTKGGIAGCCSCIQYKVTCCPSSGSCMGCGTCGDCCGD